MDELFDLEPSEFIAARDRLAKELRAAGDTEQAAAVKALRRPTLAAWAVNQVARRRPELVDAVIETGRDVTRALDQGHRDALRDATVRRRDAVVAATRAAVELAGEQHRDDIADTFEAAAGGAGEVRAGRLIQPLTPTAVFAPLGAAPPPGPETRHEPERDERALAAARARAEQADQAVMDLRGRLRTAEVAAKEAWAEVERLR